MVRVTVKPEMFRWARERAGFEPSALTGRFPRLDAWERGEAQPTLKQLESFAQATHAPIGYFFLPEPPVERIPIPDFRTIDAGGLKREQFWREYRRELERLRAITAGGSGGNFYLTLGARASKRFARALVVSTLEGRSSFTEAFRLLGLKKMASFQELGHSLGVGF